VPVVREGRRDRDEARCVEIWLAALAARDGGVDAGAVGDRTRRTFEKPIIRFALLGDEPLGFALTADDGERNGLSTAMLELLAVLPEGAGRGGGRALLEDAVSAAARARFERIDLQVRPGNLRAIGLYESAGFRPTGEVGPHPLGSGTMATYSLALTRR
jgi:ribosomal protein S18 acetylase RimI-like enzyme